MAQLAEILVIKHKIWRESFYVRKAMSIATMKVKLKPLQTTFSFLLMEMNYFRAEMILKLLSCQVGFKDKKNLFIGNTKEKKMFCVELSDEV